MSSQKRLSDVAKKNTTDRASKLAGAFLPAPPLASPPEPAVVDADVPTQPPLQEVIDEGEVDVAAGRGKSFTADEPKATVQSETQRPKERQRRSAASFNLADIIAQPVPDSVRCNKPIMLSEEHHDLFRELHFRYKKPMTSILYNVLEVVKQAYQRETKGDQSDA